METTDVKVDFELWFEAIVPQWDCKIRSVKSTDELHAAEQIAEEYDISTKHSLVKADASVKIVVRQKGKDTFKVFEVYAEEIIQYQVDEIEVCLLLNKETK